MATRSAYSGAGAVAPLWRAIQVVAATLALMALYCASFTGGSMAIDYFWGQDWPVAMLLLAVLMAWRLFPAVPLPRIAVGSRGILLVSVAMALLLWAGTHLLMYDFPLTRDEHRVGFDAAIFSHGLLAAPIAPEWRSYAEALVPGFLLRMPGNAVWVSAYMPGNAALRTVFGMLFDPALMNPVLAATGAVALYGIARHIFPGDLQARLVAVILYLTSAQMIVTAMTTYAMTGHLALNLIWLALFLRSSRLAHVGAIGIGFIATGLHQVIFHPLFVLPFLDQLRRNKQWRLLLIYCLCYAAIGLFWISYPSLVVHWAGLSAAAGPEAGGAGFISERVLPLILNRDPATLPLMSFNLIRFVAWENLALLPLVLVALPAARRGEGVARPLYYGILLTVLAMTVLLPQQGLGWGYRYLHGFIGSFALLAAYGWREMREAKPQAATLVTLGTIATLSLSLPFLLIQTRAFIRPYFDVNSMIAAQKSEFVIVDTETTTITLDEVRNEPYLTNRPLQFASHELGMEDIERLCALGTITFIRGEDMRRLGIAEHVPIGSSRFAALHDSIRGRSCDVALVPPSEK